MSSLLVKKIVRFLEETSETTITELQRHLQTIDRNRLSGFLMACEEIGILRSKGEASHKRYRLSERYAQRIRKTLLEKTFEVPTKNVRWAVPHQTRLQTQTIEFIDETPEEGGEDG